MKKKSLTSNGRKKTENFVSTPPRGLAGHLEKQGHIIRNWKKRFFILHNGRLSYYKSATPDGPNRTGVSLLGSMSLTSVEMECSAPIDHQGFDHIYLIDIITGVDLLISVPQDEAEVWKLAIRQHIEFASHCPDIVAAVPAVASSTRFGRLFSSSFSPTNTVHAALAQEEGRKRNASMESARSTLASRAHSTGSVSTSFSGSLRSLLSGRTSVSSDDHLPVAREDEADADDESMSLALNKDLNLSQTPESMNLVQMW